MDLIQAIVYGIVQGLTEFLPISSSGHLFLVSFFFGADAGPGFTAVIQLGTIVAVLIYFRKDLATTLSKWFKSFGDRTLRETPEARLGWAAVIGTVPIVVFGKLLEKKIDSDFRTAYVVAGTLIFFALVLWIAERIGKQTRGMETVKPMDGLVLGLWQALALVPGSSRSGCTISGGLFSGFNRESAARISFILAIPAIVLSGFYKLFQERSKLLDSGLAPTLVASVVSFIIGYWAISFLMKFLQKHSTMPFIVYRIALGIIILFLVATNRMPNRPTHAAAQALNHAIHQTPQRA